ncbi:MAG: hypothetical protein A3I68_07450 [Candidatus Melainabacteria bacterium RIFCSPLOWO2_02_FULL_35_15]|nr:MAG: hypothetical protein A3I68_07450 [Candidatus Melainabacteria bacterium RIFCSPLOWO2_02_FULL_35_15]
MSFPTKQSASSNSSTRCDVAILAKTSLGWISVPFNSSALFSIQFGEWVKTPHLLDGDLS